MKCPTCTGDDVATLVVTGSVTSLYGCNWCGTRWRGSGKITCVPGAIVGADLHQKRCECDRRMHMEGAALVIQFCQDAHATFSIEEGGLTLRVTPRS